jgi:hypothetical protein
MKSSSSLAIPNLIFLKIMKKRVYLSFVLLKNGLKNQKLIKPLFFFVIVCNFKLAGNNAVVGCFPFQIFMIQHKKRLGEENENQ